MKKVDVLIVVAFVLVNIAIGYSHPPYLDEFFTFNIARGMAEMDFDQVIEDYKLFGPTPLTQILSALFYSIFQRDWAFRLPLVFGHAGLFALVIFFARKILKREKDAFLLAFYVCLCFPLLYSFHFLYAEGLSVLFLLLALFYYFQKKHAKSAASTALSFLSKQLGIAPWSLLFYAWLKKRLETKELAKYSLVVIVPLFAWIWFCLKYYNTPLSPDSHGLLLSPVLLLGKASWLIGIMGFYALPFFFCLASGFFKNIKEKKTLFFLLLLLLFPFSLKFFYSRSFGVGGEDFRIHGRLPLFYHALPKLAYQAFVFILFVAGVFFIYHLYEKRKPVYALLIFSICSIIILLGGKGQVICEVRHTAYLGPIIFLALAKDFRLGKLEKLLILLLILYSVLWSVFLVGLAGVSGEARAYLQSKEDGGCYVSNLPLYNFPSNCDESNASFIVSASGFSKGVSTEGLSIEKTFKTNFGTYKVEVFAR